MEIDVIIGKQTSFGADFDLVEGPREEYLPLLQVILQSILKKNRSLFSQYASE